MSANKHMYFNDGEAVDHADFNKMIQYIEKMYHDHLFFGRCAEIDAIYEGNEGGFSGGGGDASFAAKLFVTGTANQAYISSSSGDDRDRVNHRAGTGIITIGNNDPFALADNLRTMQSFLIDNSSLTESGPAPTPFRWRTYYYTVNAESTLGSETRDFKDSVTGALSSQSQPKQKTQVPTFTSVNGTAGGGLPSIPAGAIPVYSIKIYDSYPLIDPFEVIDYTFPCNYGAMKTASFGSPVGQWQSASVTSWANPVALVNPRSYQATRSGTGGAALYLLPAVFGGSHHARFLSLDLVYRIDTGITVNAQLQRQTPSGTATNIGSSIPLTANSGTQRLIIKGSDLSLPVWSNGYNAGHALSKDKDGAITVVHPTGSLALEIEQDTTAGDIEISTAIWTFAV